MRDIVTSAIALGYPTPEASTRVPLLPSISSPRATVVALQHNAGSLTPSDPPSLPSSALSSLDYIPPTYPPRSLHSSISRSSLSPSFPESHRSIIVTTAASTSAENDGGPKPGSCKERDADPLSADCAIHPNTMVTLDLPSLQVEHTGDQSPRPSHCQCDIV
ncbi:hypothetical protein EDB83DRAFT_185477 [Lactarius deliciosus]|nr:hypothetical protein EDB83DRAFT_185477 [Lactarius deliciosus]